MLQGGCSSTVGDEKLQDCLWLVWVFFLFWGSMSLFCQAATVCLCSCKVFPPCLTPSCFQPVPKQDVGALCSPLLHLKCELQTWEKLFWTPSGCKAIVVLFSGTIHPSPLLPSYRGMGFDFVMGMAGHSLPLTTLLRSGLSWKILVLGMVEQI